MVDLPCCPGMRLPSRGQTPPPRCCRSPLSLSHPSAPPPPGDKCCPLPPPQITSTSTSTASLYTIAHCYPPELVLATPSHPNDDARHLAYSLGSPALRVHVSLSELGTTIVGSLHASVAIQPSSTWATSAAGPTTAPPSFCGTRLDVCRAIAFPRSRPPNPHSIALGSRLTATSKQ